MIRKITGRNRKSTQGKSSKPPTSKGGHSSNAPRLSRSALTDEEWGELSRIIPISRKQRLDIEVWLAVFTSERASSKTSLQTKRRIAKLRRYATKLETELHQLLEDPIFYSAGRPSWSALPRPAKDDFHLLFAQLETLQAVLEVAQTRTSMKPGRKAIEPIDGLVKQLNWVLTDIGRSQVIRSGKDSGKAESSKFIRFCCRKVGLSDGQIDRALRRNVAEYHRGLEYQAFDVSADEPVNEDERRSRGKRSRPRSRSML